MCEKLFRGKRTDNGKWVEGGYIPLDVDSGYEYIVEPCNYASTFSALDKIKLNSILVIPETVGQFTGLTDKNGTRIFEGDIVRAFTRFSEIYVSSVAYHDGTFWFKNWSWTKFLFKFEKIEVIGNIHDNPELLEGGGDNA